MDERRLLDGPIPDGIAFCRKHNREYLFFTSEDGLTCPDCKREAFALKEAAIKSALARWNRDGRPIGTFTTTAFYLPRVPTLRERLRRFWKRVRRVIT